MGGEQVLQIAAQYGAAGVMAVVLFLVLRGQNEVLMTVVKDNTAVNAKLCEKLDRVIDERSGEDRRHRG